MRARLILTSTILMISMQYQKASASAAKPPAMPAPQSSNSGPFCELHIFPTLDYINSSPEYARPPGTYGSGLLGDFIGQKQKSGSGKFIPSGLDQMKTLLTPEIQVQEIKANGILDLLKLPSDTKIVVEAPLPSEDQAKSDPSFAPYYAQYTKALKKSVAISTSTAACYRELRVVYASLSKGLGSLKFSTSFTYRTFDQSHSETHIYDGERSVPKPEHFPALLDDQMGEAGTDIRRAFTQILKDWITHRVKV